MAKFSVLLIDDEEELVTTLVERLGYRDVDADYVTSGYDVEGKLNQRSFDVILLDIKMPGLSGRDVLEIIRRKDKDVPVLLITGHGSPVEGEIKELEGVQDYIAKPINLDQLIEKLEEAVKSE